MDVQNEQAGGSATNDANDEDNDDNFDDFFENTLDKSKFLQLKGNDPSLTSVTLDFNSVCHAHSIDWGNEGGCIAANTHLEKLGLTISDKDDALEKMEEFCTCLSGNTSIRMLRCDCYLDARHLLPFIQNNDNL